MSIKVEELMTKSVITATWPKTRRHHRSAKAENAASDFHGMQDCSHVGQCQNLKIRNEHSFSPKQTLKCVTLDSENGQ